MNIKLNVFSLQLIDRITSCLFFAHVGKPLDGDYCCISSWEIAEKMCTDLTMSNRMNDFANRLRRQVPWEVFNSTWNELNDTVSDSISEVYRNIIPALLNDYGLSQAGIEDVANICRRCMVLGIMENEYDEYGVDDYFRTCLKVLLQGHLVCGYDGEWPSGKLIVY